MVETATYTHPDCPGIALRAEHLVGDVWLRSLLIGGEVVHTRDHRERNSDRHTAQIQASQAGFWLTAWAQGAGRDAVQAAELRAIIGERSADIDELASHIDQDRAVVA